MQKINLHLIIILVLIIYSIIITVLFVRQKPTEVLNPDYTNKIDSLENVIISYTAKNDSLLYVIANTTDSITYINNWYEKDITFIKSATVDSNINFFTDYLSKNIYE